MSVYTNKMSVYLDNNATALCPPAVIETYVAWLNRGHPAGAHAGGRDSQQMIDNFRRHIAAEGGFELATGLPPHLCGRPRPAATRRRPRRGGGTPAPPANRYYVVFTSGASESNCAVITGAVRSFTATTGILPHVITSNREHASVRTACDHLVAENLCTHTMLRETTVAALKAALRLNTCIVSIIAADPDTGAFADVRGLAAVAHAARVPFHTDAAQLYGRSAFRPAALGIDAASFSFHKIGGVPGVGALIIRQAFVFGFGIAPMIGGPENRGLRGGTENVPALAAAFAAARLADSDRPARIARMRACQEALRIAISAEPSIVWMGPADSRLALPNTALLAADRPSKEVRAELEAAGFIVGGPVQPRADAARLIRVSFGFNTTVEEVKAFAAKYLIILRS